MSPDNSTPKRGVSGRSIQGMYALPFGNEAMPISYFVRTCAEPTIHVNKRCTAPGENEWRGRSNFMT